jgi:hypothetical protein
VKVGLIGGGSGWTIIQAVKGKPTVYFENRTGEIDFKVGGSKAGHLRNVECLCRLERKY